MHRTANSGTWAAFSRWVASAGIGLTLALCYMLFQPAAAQDKSPAPATTANGAANGARPLSGNPAGETLLTGEQSDRLAAAALAESEKNGKDAKTAPVPATTESFDIIKVVRDGGVHMWAVYAILGVSVVALAFALERFMGLRRSKVLPADLIAGLRALTGRKGEFDLRHAQRLCKQHPSSAATVVRAMLAKVGRPVPEIEHAMSEASDKEATRLYANVRWQNLAFNVAPMLGLAGTVHGMIIAFFVTAHMPLGANKMESLATGIYAALVCTFAGLMVAIPAGVLAHFFEGRILKLFQELDEVTQSLVPHLERFEGRPRLKVSADKTSSEPATLEMPKSDASSDVTQPSWPAIAPGE